MTWDQIGQILINDFGLLPIIFGLLYTFLPSQPTTAYVVFALFDVAICLMVAHIFIRWKFPRWVGITAALIQATYIPSVIGSGAVLQQPLITFFLTLSVWAYTMAFTSRLRLSMLWTGVGTLAAVALGFSSLSTRPLAWVIFVAVLITTFSDRNLRHIFRLQVNNIFLLLTLASCVLLADHPLRWLLPSAVIILSIMINFYSPASRKRVIRIGRWTGLAIAAIIILASHSSISTERISAFSELTTGLSSQGTARVQVTPISFANFWPPDDWFSYKLNPTVSLFGDFVRAPGKFLEWLNYGLVSNWRYPHYLYMQSYILDLPQQRIEHVIFVILGFVGISWLIGQRGEHRHTLLIIVFAGSFLSLLYGLISVEPRRFIALSPFMAIGAAACLWSIVMIFQKRVLWVRWGLVMLALCILSWSMTPGFALWILPEAVPFTHGLLVIVRSLLTLAVVLWLTASWKLTGSQFRRRLACGALVIPLFLVTIYQFQETEWRTWTSQTTSKVRQEISNVRLQDGRWPWLILDVESPEQAQNLTIYVNNRSIKGAGEPMQTWRAGAPPIWAGTYTLLERMSDLSYETWLAVPIPRELINADQVTIDLLPGKDPVTIRGDYLDQEDGPYIGPLFDPWYTGVSLWRWIWNGSDPRIPWVQPLNGQHYRSSMLDHDLWKSDDLSPDFGIQSGLFRIFLVQSPISPLNDALPALNTQKHARNSNNRCREDKSIADNGNGWPFVCQSDDNATVTYYAADGSVIGTSPGSLYLKNAARDTVVDRIITPTDRVEVLQIMPGLFIANFYVNNGSPGYTMTIRINRS